jgi:sialic acid synthase
VNLNTIRFLQNNYPQYNVGFSDHTLGIFSPVAAVAMGATIIEKHITTDRNLKGTDQRGSLGPDGIRRMVRDIRELELSMGEVEMKIEDSVTAARLKLERSIAAVHEIPSGKIIEESDLRMLSPGDGFKWSQRNLVVGKRTTSSIPANEIIYPIHLED